MTLIHKYGDISVKVVVCEYEYVKLSDYSEVMWPYNWNTL